MHLLADSGMSGRGFVRDGMGIAADFLESELALAGALPLFNSDYKQPLSTPVNTFPNRLEFSLQTNSPADSALQFHAGVNFQVEPYSPSFSGTAPVVWPDIQTLFSAELSRSIRNEKVFLAYDLREVPVSQKREFFSAVQTLIQSPGKWQGLLLFQTEKLTWSGSTEVAPRPVLTARLDSANLYDLQQIKSIATVQIESEFLKSFQFENIGARVPGTGNTGKAIYLTAHYDHIGMMGSKALYPGANDNASGTAMLLELARFYSLNPDDRPSDDLVFIFFGAEEIGLKGSFGFTDSDFFSKSSIRFLVNLDICGTGNEGIKVVNGKQHPKTYQQLCQINDTHNLLPAVKLRGESCNSDHCPFHLRGVPSFFIYTLGGLPHYHDVHDRAEVLSLDKFSELTELLIHFIASFEE